MNKHRSVLDRMGRGLLLIMLSVLCSVVIVLIYKPFQLQLVISTAGAPLNDMVVYFARASNRVKPTSFAQAKSAQITSVPMASTSHTLTIRSALPVRFLRLDPSTEPVNFSISEIRFVTGSGPHIVAVEELVALVSSGHQLKIAGRDRSSVTLSATGVDPYFSIPIPESVLTSAYREYCRALILTGLASVLLAVLIPMILSGLFALLKRACLALSRLWLYGLSRSQVHAQRVKVAANCAGAAALGLALLHQASLHDWWSIARLQDAFADDGVGFAVPAEVRNMKTLIQRHSLTDFDLLRDLGDGAPHTEIYQRASEYLYPARINEKARYKFIRSSDAVTLATDLCKEIDREHTISLVVCR